MFPLLRNNKKILSLGSKLLLLALWFCAQITSSATMKNAVVTGANRGLGLELCKQLAEGDLYSSVYALCRKTTEELTQLALKSTKIKVVEGVEVTKDDAVSVLQTTFQSLVQPIPIHLLVHNAGAYGPPEGSILDYKSQTFDNITAERMRYAFDLNTLAPLMLTKALIANLQAAASSAEAPAKIVIMSSAMGSIEENTSGGHYGYRTAKAGVNMVGKSLSHDLKDKNIAVSLVHPGMVYTGFGGIDAERRPGQRDVDESTRGVIEAIEKTSIETTGSFFHGNYGEGVKLLAW